MLGAPPGSDHRVARRPWELDAQAATVDQLSGGRVILTVGLGAAETDQAGISRRQFVRISAKEGSDPSVVSTRSIGTQP